MLEKSVVHALSGGESWRGLGLATAAACTLYAQLVSFATTHSVATGLHWHARPTPISPAPSQPATAFPPPRPSHLQRLELVAHALLGGLVQDAGIIQDVGGGGALSQQVKLARQRSRGQRRAQQQRRGGGLRRRAAAGGAGAVCGYSLAGRAASDCCQSHSVNPRHSSRWAMHQHIDASQGGGRRSPPLPGGPAPALASAAAPGTPPRGSSGPGWRCCWPQTPAA